MNDKLHQEWIKKRKILFASKEKHVEIKKNDERIKQSRVCAICSRPLVTFTRRGWKTLHAHRRFNNGIFSYSVCDNPTQCWEYYRERKLLSNEHSE